jgi:hypothetical protein
MHMGEFKEKRLYRRFPCFFEGTISFNGTAEKFICKDISPQGVGLLIRRPLVVDSQINIQLTTKNKIDLNVGGKVCWCEQQSESFRVGVKFNKSLFMPLDLIV